VLRAGGGGGQRRGPSEEQLARAHVATLAADVVHDIAHLSGEALEILWEGLFDLPAIDLSLQVRLPDLITPELQRLRDAAIDDDPDRGWEEPRVVTDQIDTPQQRDPDQSASAVTQKTFPRKRATL
jgi:hypothetical protein